VPESKQKVLLACRKRKAFRYSAIWRDRKGLLFL